MTGARPRVATRLPDKAVGRSVSYITSPLRAGQVKLLEAHVRQGVSQLQAAKELSEVAQRSLAEAGGRPGRADGCWSMLRSCADGWRACRLPCTPYLSCCLIHPYQSGRFLQRGGPHGPKPCCGRWTSARLQQRWSGARLRMPLGSWSSRWVGGGRQGMAIFAIMAACGR